MKRTMSLMMAMLMLTSLLASVSMFELEDEWNEEAGGRAGYEVELVGTMEPRPSVQDLAGGWRNTVDVGEDVNFLLVALNSGTIDITEMYVSVDVTAGGTTVGGTGGSPDGAVCDDSTMTSAGNPVCASASFAAGDYLAFGSYAVRDSLGDPLTWTPSTPGEYEVTISVDPGDQDTDLTNNDLVFDVMVTDWYDIGVDLTWDNPPAGGSGDDDMTSTGPHDFTLSAVVDGSTEWNPRNVELEVTFGGTFLLLDPSTQVPASTFEGNPCPSQNECVFSAMMGTDTTLDVYQNLSEEPQQAPTQGTRKVPTFQTAETFSGTIQGDGGDCSGACSMYVHARVVNYLSYENVLTDYGGIGGPDIVSEMKEVDNSVDDDNGNNEDIIEALFGVYHDISVNAITVGADLRSEGGRMDAGVSVLYATIGYSGSEDNIVYDWNVSFDINDGQGGVTTISVSDCDLPDHDQESYQSHTMLGMQSPGLPEVTVCTLATLNPGMLSITARANLIDASLTDNNGPSGGNDPSDDCGTTGNPDCNSDMNSANDDRTGHYEVVNNGPFVTLTMEAPDGPIMELTTLDFSARALHPGQPSAVPLIYEWSVNTAEEDQQFMGCMGMSDCAGVIVGHLWLGTSTVQVTVTDNWGATTTDSVTMTVWHSLSTSWDGETADVDYDIVFAGTLMQEFNFSNTSNVDADLTGGGSSYTSIAAFSTQTSSVLTPGDVYSEDMTVSFAGAADKQYSLWYQGTTGWVNMPATQAQVDATTMSLAWSNDGTQPSRSSSTYAVFAGANVGEPPQTGITDLSYELQPAGVIAISWSVGDAAALSADDFGVITVDGVRETFQLSTNTTEIYGMHGTTYSFSVQIENGQSDSSGNPLVGSPVASDSATADAQVDPAAGASELAAVEEAGNTVAFTWSAADDTDVHHWVVCWSIGDHDATEVAGLMDADNSCSASGDKTATHVSWRPSAAGTYHYSVSAVDDVGNVEAAGSSTALQFAEDQNIDWTTPPDIGTEGGDDAIPQSAWIAIAVLVLVAVIAGAFILTRGGGEGGDEEWDY